MCQVSAVNDVLKTTEASAARMRSELDSGVSVWLKPVPTLYTVKNGLAERTRERTDLEVEDVRTVGRLDEHDLVLVCEIEWVG